MTAMIIPFPTAIGRADIEFERTGQTDYTRAMDASSLLYNLAQTGRRDAPDFDQQLAALTASVQRLSKARPEVVDELVILDDGKQHPLRKMPVIIRSITTARRCETRKETHS